MKYYFFKTLPEGSSGRNRLRPLSGQTFEDGRPVDPTMNVSSDKTLRVKYPLETIFVSDTLTTAKGYYNAGSIFPILSAEEYLESSHRPKPEAVTAYMKFVSPGGEMPTDKTTIKRRKTLLKRLEADDSLSVPTIKEDGFHVDKNVWYLLMRNIKRKVNTMFVGPTGAGKSELVMLACERLGIDCSVYDMGSMHDPVAGMLGVHRLQKGGVSVFDYAKFVQDVQKPGVILLDELSRAPVTTANILFPCLDSRRSLPVEIAGGDDLRSVKVHKDCCFIATANVGAEYTGTMSMDKALVNRFFPVELSYLPTDIEIGLLKERCVINGSDATNIVMTVSKIRSLYVKGEISSSVSTRESLMIGDLVADGWTVLDSLECVLLPMFEGTTLEGERSIISKIIMSL